MESHPESQPETAVVARVAHAPRHAAGPSPELDAATGPAVLAGKASGPGPAVTATAATTRALLAPLITALAICAIFVTVYLAAFHAPVAHDQPLGIAASDQVATATETTIDRLAPGAFTFTRYPDAAAALDAVTHDRIPAVLVADARGERLMAAGAQGPSLVSTVSATVNKAAGHAVPVQDVVPLSAGDTRGLSAFYAAFGVVLAGFLFSVSMHQAAPRLSLPARAGATVVFAVISGLVVALIADTATGALPAPLLTVAAVMGLLAWASACAAGMLLRVFGKLGVPVASIILLILGNATATGTLPATFLPSWLAPLAHVMPPAAAVQGLRGASYFHDAHLVSALIVLSAWAVGCLAVHNVHERTLSRSRHLL